MRLPTGHLSGGKLRITVLAFVLCGGVSAVFFLPAAAAEKKAAPAEAVFELRELSAFDKSDIQSRLTRGEYAECTTEPDKAVKAYPKLKSKRPLYGKLLFDRDFSRGKSIEYHFVLDESGEPPAAEKKSEARTAETAPEKSLWQRLVEKLWGAAENGAPAKKPAKPEARLSRYDRLYIDLNRDFDLTNDPVQKPMKTPPWQSLPHWMPQERMAFDYLDIPVDYGPGVGVRPFRILAWLTLDEEKGQISATMDILWPPSPGKGEFGSVVTSTGRCWPSPTCWRAVLTGR